MGLPCCHTLVMSLSDSANGAVGSARTIWVAGSIATTTPLPPIHPMASGAQMATPASMRTPAPVVGVYETGSQLAMWGGSERWVHTEMKFKVNEKWCPWNSLVKMNEDLSHLRIMMADLLDWCSHRCWFIGRISPV